MSYSCCYVLTDDETLQFYNQMMVSLSSLRYTGFAGKVYIVSDQETATLLNARYTELEELSAELVTVNIQDDYYQIEKSRYLKTSLRKYIKGDALYIDTDTIFVACLPEVISDSELAMAQDRNGLDDKTSYTWHKTLSDQCRLELPDGMNQFFNAGVIWMRDTPSVNLFFSQWHALWKKLLSLGVFNDQISLHHLYKSSNQEIQLLDNRYNVQIGQPYFSLPMITNAYILHMYNNQCDSPVYSLLDPCVQRLDYRDEAIQKIIHDPLSGFSVCSWIPKDSVLEKCINSDTLLVLRKHKHVFTFGEYIFHVIRKVRHKIRRLFIL